MRKKIIFIILIIVVLLITLLLFNKQKVVGLEDIYINKFVYLNKDSCLFTGLLKDPGESSSRYCKFCSGIPCGEAGEQQIGGGYVSKGEFLGLKEYLSKTTLKQIENNIVFMKYWQEGGDFSYDPYHLSVYILKDDAFFQSDIKQNDDFIDQLAESILRDTHNLKYLDIKIAFVNSVFDWSKEYFKEYPVHLPHRTF